MPAIPIHERTLEADLRHSPDGHPTRLSAPHFSGSSGRSEAVVTSLPARGPPGSRVARPFPTAIHRREEEAAGCQSRRGRYGS
ncbi:hypothetical protein AB205_0161160 [Aquarana catesbeiana]|uniref:Uncharacterized protein n=1 Tax=Aquarana catesbeiana TaxID=8400 RepID=A0A2G9RF21_AQUCT|nr:hypothetical protein AB205_0161160 [Aquarana catesbeiana]PIO26506.1 hypothetical protein AB205_0161160 [Aquarana catesbeiana]